MHAIEWLQLLLVFIIGAISPGPSTIYILNAAVICAKKDAIHLAIGHGLGVLTLGILALLGVHTILYRAPNFEIYLQWISIIVLIIFGVMTLRTGNTKTIAQTPKPLAPLSIIANILKGYTFATINPLVIVYFGAIFSQLTLISQHLFLQAIAMLLLFIIDAGYYTLLVVIIKTERSIELFNRHKEKVALCSGMLLIAIAISFVLKLILI